MNKEIFSTSGTLSVIDVELGLGSISASTEYQRFSISKINMFEAKDFKVELNPRSSYSDKSTVVESVRRVGLYHAAYNLESSI